MAEKQHTPEFESCIQEVMQQGHEKGSAFAICTTTFQRAGKPIFVGESETQKLHLFSENINLEGNKVSGVAIHPKRIFHPEEGTFHVYLREELERAAPTLVGKPFGIDHVYVLPPPNLVTKAFYDSKEDGVAFDGFVDDHIAEQIRSKAFKGLSIELDWFRPGGKIEYVNGVAARNFDLSSVHFLKIFPPGDREAYIKLWENVNFPSAIGESGQPAPSQTIGVENMKPEELKPLIEEAVKQQLAPMLEAIRKLKEAEWDTAWINDLPDSAFAVIGSGGQKDEQDKTVPRTLRHLPHHGAGGALDLPHLRNALARLPQTDISAEDQAEAKRHLCAHAKESEIVSEVCGEEKPPAESEAMVALRKQLVESEATVANLQKDLKAAIESKGKLVESIKSKIPEERVIRSWSWGPQQFVRQIEYALGEKSG